MEKQSNNQSRSKNKILKYLPKARVSFQNPPFSPGFEKRCDAKLKLFSGPIIARTPVYQSRGKSRDNFEAQEPTSPKVSCIGQVRYKKPACLKKEVHPVSSSRPPTKGVSSSTTRSDQFLDLKRKPSGIKRIFSSRRKSDAGCERDRQPPLTDRAPMIGKMTRFASSRETLANFDWRSGTMMTPDTVLSSCNTDGASSDWENDLVIKFSAPLVVAKARGSEPRKEIGLWKRRAMVAQPKPLQLNLVRAQ